MKNLRVCIAIATFLPMVGGTEKQALMQGKSLHQRGIETMIITLRHDLAWPKREQIDDIPVLRVAGTLLNGRERLPRQLSQLCYLLALLLLGWTVWLHRRHYDLVHVYQLSLLTPLVALACYLADKPMVVAVRSAGSGKPGWLHNQASLLAGTLDPASPCLRVDGQTYVDGDLEGLERLGRPIVLFTQWLLRHMRAALVVLSQRMKGYVIAHGFALPCMQLIPNGVDTTLFLPSPRDIASHEQRSRANIVICVSKLRYEKGIDVLLHAWKLVQERQPEARLRIVGDGPLQNQFAHMARALDISDTIEFMGLQRDIAAQLCQAAIAVLPSRWEGMPNAVLEAMAGGLPCVATRVSGSEDVIEHKVNGLLVEPEDYQGLAQALLTLLHNPPLINQYGQAACTRIEEHYALACITDRYIELYQALIGKKDVAFT